MLRCCLAWLVLTSAGAGLWGAGAEPASQAGTEIRLGFWKLTNFEDYRRVRPEIRQVARALHSMDCAGLVGVYDDRILSKLVNELSIIGGKWDKVVAPDRVGYRKATAQRYAFVFRSDKLEVRDPPRILKRRSLTVPGRPNRFRFEHPPFACSFASLDHRLDFAALVVEITRGNDPVLATARSQRPAAKVQTAELAALAGYFAEAQALAPNEANVILLGHLRRDVGDPALDPLLRLPGMIDGLSSTAPTSIDNASTPDHILYQIHGGKDPYRDRGVVRFDETVYQGDLERARHECSRYRPIWLDLEVPIQDED